MQKTVIILRPARDMDLAPTQPLVITIDGSSQGAAVAGPDKTKRTVKSRMHTGSAPAFWTWFVENPRPTRRGQLG
jgi:hypothetical protein